MALLPYKVIFVALPLIVVHSLLYSFCTKKLFLFHSFSFSCNSLITLTIPSLSLPRTIESSSVLARLFIERPIPLSLWMPPFTLDVARRSRRPVVTSTRLHVALARSSSLDSTTKEELSRAAAVRAFNPLLLTLVKAASLWKSNFRFSLFRATFELKESQAFFPLPKTKEQSNY